jgi:hypothetical protein
LSDYWEQFEQRQKHDAEVDHVALKLAQSIKVALPKAYVFKIRDNCYMVYYGWSYSFVDAGGILIREWGGHHTPDTPIEKLVRIMQEQNDYWVKRYGHESTNDWHEMQWAEKDGYTEIVV